MNQKYYGKKVIRSFMIMLLIMSFFISLFSAISIADQTVSAAAEPVNLAAGKTVTNSDIEGEGLEGDKAVDGSMKTRWSSAFSDPQWLMIDLGETCSFSKVVIYWETAFSKAYEIQMSDEANNWTTVYSEQNGDGDVGKIKNLSAEGRYLRLYCTERATGWGNSIWELEIYESSQGIILDGSSPEIGNIFAEGKELSFQIGVEIDVEQKSDVLTKYKVLSYENRKLDEGQFFESVEKGNTIKAYDIKSRSDLPVGVYKLVVDSVTTDGKLNTRKEIPFSIISESVVLPGDCDIGTNTHFGQGIGNEYILLTRAKDAGFKLIRDGYHWANVEEEKGKYIFEYDRYIRVALGKGLEPLVILAEGNPFYDEGRAPESDEGIAGFANYAKALAEHLKGKVRYFEVWNEWNGGMGNPKLLNAAAYVKMLKAVYIAVKEANPDAMVVGGVTVLADYGWVEQMLEAGGGSYMDAFSYHPHFFTGQNR